ncbi:MAG: hypothetical protein J0L64_06530 [Acidobacteria bacterium]|nr:hypothetical protein [Acidobacteriota bacterium]
MTELSVELANLEDSYLNQVQYALTFASESVEGYCIDRDAKSVRLRLRPGADQEEVSARVRQLLGRFESGEFGFKSVVHMDRRRELPKRDTWAELLDRRWVTQVGEGQVILRGPAAELARVIDHKVESEFVREFQAEHEIYPPTINCRTLDRCGHFTSFPEHVDFVAHLRPDLEHLRSFAERCRERGWQPDHHEGKMHVVELAISPSCCYHCYEGMSEWRLPPPGRCVTATLSCHRYEGANHQSLARLRSFTMREVIWVGQPAFVLAARARAEELIQRWAGDWELSCTFETANDMFFTDDFAVKASFQRQQEAKRELRADLPFEGQSLSLFSSNFHSATFGKAFHIQVSERPATSGCIGWGYERWVYAVFCQFGCDWRQWPDGLRRDWDAAGGRLW